MRKNEFENLIKKVGEICERNRNYFNSDTHYMDGYMYSMSEILGRLSEEKNITGKQLTKIHEIVSNYTFGRK